MEKMKESVGLQRQRNCIIKRYVTGFTVFIYSPAGAEGR